MEGIQRITVADGKGTPEVRGALDYWLAELCKLGLDAKWTESTVYQDKGELSIRDKGEVILVHSQPVDLDYALIAQLANIFERKSFELQFNPLLPRMAALGWSAYVSASNSNRVQIQKGDDSSCYLSPTLLDLAKLRQEIDRAECRRDLLEKLPELMARGWQVEVFDDHFRAQSPDADMLSEYDWHDEDMQEFLIVSGLFTKKKP